MYALTNDTPIDEREIMMEDADDKIDKNKKADGDSDDEDDDDEDDDNNDDDGNDEVRPPSLNLHISRQEARDLALDRGSLPVYTEAHTR